MEILYLILFAYVMYILIVSIGITYGYHRYFSHHEFCAKPWQEIVILYCGLLCGGRSPLTWVGIHRMHHTYSDTDLDPHNKNLHSWYVILFSLWHVDHIPRRFLNDMLRNPRVMFFHKHRHVLYWTSLLLFTLLFGIEAFVVLGIIYLLSYIGFGALNLWGHNAEGPINNIWLNFIAPWEGNHKDHHKVNII